MSTSFKQKFAQLGDGVSEIKRRVAALERAGGGGGGSGGGDVNVLDYGASADGDHDDSSDVRDAFIDAERSAGKSKVRFPDGTYLLEDKVKIPSNVTPVGAGMGNSVIEGVLNGDPTLELDNSDNVKFEGLSFTKDAAPDNSDRWFFDVRGHNIRFFGCEWFDLPRQGGLFRGEDITMAGCRVSNTGRDGFLFAGVDNPTVAFCRFFRTGDDSVAFNVDTENGSAFGNTVIESGWHHAGGAFKVHGNNCVVGPNVIARPNTYAVRIQNRDEDAASEGPWPNRNIFGFNVVNGMGERGGSKNYAVEVKALNGEVSLPYNTINTYDGVDENRRGMRLRATGPTTRIEVAGGSISMSPEHEPKRAIVVEEEFERLEIDGLSLYDTATGISKRNAAEPAGDAEIRDVYFDPNGAQPLFDMFDDDGFETMRVRGCTSKSPGAEFVDCNNAKFGLVQVHDNLARDHSILADDTGRVDDLVTGPL